MSHTRMIETRRRNQSRKKQLRRVAKQARKTARKAGAAKAA